jgi:AcrR family transcriptional regulator
MGRRSDHTREELTAMAVQAGMRLIEENGFQNFSARAAAARIGYAVGTIYHVFGNLDGFILQINSATLDEWYEELKAGLAAHTGDPVRYLAMAYLEFARRNRQRFNALFEHHLPEDAPFPDWYAAKSDRMFSLLETALVPRYKDPVQTRHMARLLWAGVHGITVLALTNRVDADGDDSAARLITSMLDLTLGTAADQHPQSRG